MTQPILSALVAIAIAASPQPAKPSQSEAAFVAQVTQALTAEFPTTADAKAHGYMQMTHMESDGTIIYATMRYDGIDVNHPNFLWYDRNGRLVGLDYEYPKYAWAKPPGAHFYPVASSRWTTVGSHEHFAYTIAGGPMQYHGARPTPNLEGKTITADELRADGLLPKGAKLAWAEFHPSCWDLGFWVVPNPNGAFADLDPLVK
jgi:hypothetical protein